MGKITLEKIECPVCKGSGKILSPRSAQKKRTIDRYAIARTLVNDGFSYREVADALGYKSIRSVAIAVEKGRENKNK